MKKKITYKNIIYNKLKIKRKSYIHWNPRKFRYSLYPYPKFITLPNFLKYMFLQLKHEAPKYERIKKIIKLCSSVDQSNLSRIQCK